MAITMKEKFDSINLSKLPENYKSEFETIKTKSKDFNPKFVPIFQDNFDILYDLVEKKHPEALKKGGVIKKVKPAKVVKVKAKKEPEKTMVHKSRGMKKVYVKNITLPKIKYGAVTLVVDYRKGQVRDVNHPYTVTEFEKVPEDLKDQLRKMRTKDDPEHDALYEEERKEEPKASDEIEECRKALNEAGYTTKKKLSKDGKRAMKAKEPRPERAVIHDKVADVFKTINKDISGSEEKDKDYKKMQFAIAEMQNLMSKLMQLVNNLAADNSMEKVEKIISLLKKIVP
jgi:hypothetical protein